MIMNIIIVAAAVILVILAIKNILRGIKEGECAGCSGSSPSCAFCSKINYDNDIMVINQTDEDVLK